MPIPLTLPPQITVGDLNFVVRESDRRRTVGITIDRDGSLFLHAPAGAKPDAVAAWAWSKRGWVFRKLADKHLLLAATPAKEFVTGEGFDYLGRHYRLQLVGDTPNGMVKLERGRLTMPRAQAEAGRGKRRLSIGISNAPRPGCPGASGRGPSGWACNRETLRSATSAIGGVHSAGTIASTSTGPPCNCQRP